MSNNGNQNRSLIFNFFLKNLSCARAIEVVVDLEVEVEVELDVDVDVDVEVNRDLCPVTRLPFNYTI